jgi:hypothetical protein
LDFYVFQTPCDVYNPKLLIIGINPGGSKPYSVALQEKNQQEKGYGEKRRADDLGYGENTLAAKPQWEIDAKLKGADRMRSSLHKVFHKDNNLDILEDTVMMNMFYFNTKQAKDINNISDEIREYCKTKTLEFIDILNPQNILYLTTDDSNLKACGVTSLKETAKFVR